MMRTHERIYQALQAAGVPMTAYEVLDELRVHGISAPLTVYRALDRLVEERRVHRLESLKAYVACCDPSHHHGAAIFAICRDCRGIEEYIEPGILKDLRTSAEERGFAMDLATIELQGHCALCRERVMALE